MNTELLYMTNGELLEYETLVEEVGANIMILPGTIFYPQGGGQPYDQGEIRGKYGVFKVSEVRNIEGVVQHIGTLEGELAVGEKVACHVDGTRRALNSRAHSAGHLIDMAVHRAGYTWIPGKGYSFPEGPYVEYGGDVSGIDISEATAKIEQACAELIAEDLPVRIEFMTLPEMKEKLLFVPENVPTNRPARVVFMGDYGIPCGGTHVRSLKEIGTVSLRKIKLKGDVLRVSYQIA